MLNLKSLNYSQKVYGLILGFHALCLLILSAFTFPYLTGPLVFSYLCFSLLFLITTLYSAHILLTSRTGIFAYLLNLMFLFGFWFKFSIQKITNAPYREPIGRFVFTPQNEANVLWVASCGICGFLLALIVFQKFFNHKVTSLTPQTDYKKNSIVWFIILSFFALLLAAINLKYNILLFGYKPSIQFPLKGNAIFFLVLTRFIPFLFFYYCFRHYSNRMVVGAGLLAMICSVGVLSRMVVLGIFCVLYFYILKHSINLKLKDILKKSLCFFALFILFSYVTVLVASGLREFTVVERIYLSKEIPAKIIPLAELPVIKRTIASTEGIIAKSQRSYFNFREKLIYYKELALGRWIGIEGLMAVASYPEKNFLLLWNGIKEKSYSGYSFYSKFSDPEKSPEVENFKVISTSVPGPIAFFYYSGSELFVSFAIFFCVLLCFWIEKIVFHFFSFASLASIYVSTFMVFDFFQFGISPLAFLRYWGFSFFCLFSFYYLTQKKWNKTIHAKP